MDEEPRIPKSKEVEPQYGVGFLVLIYLLFFAFFVTLYHLAKTGEWTARTTKSQLAKKYGLQKFETLRIWIEKFCSQDVKDKYVGNQKHLIIPSELYPFLGNPEDYPVDLKKRSITDKKELARAFDVEHRTISRCLQGFENLEEQIGMDYTQYKNLKKIPPLYMNRVVDTLKSKGFTLGGKKKAKLT